MTIDVAALAREIAARLAPEALIDTADIAALVHRSPGYVSRVYLPLPSFPRPVNLPADGGSRGHALYYRRDVLDWIQSHQAKRVPR